MTDELVTAHFFLDNVGSPEAPVPCRSDILPMWPEILGTFSALRVVLRS